MTEQDIFDLSNFGKMKKLIKIEPKTIKPKISDLIK
jgi:hypothetical protein